MQASLRHLALIAAISAPLWACADEPVRPDQVVGAMEQQAGITPGHRRNHINGICVSGHFTGDPAVAKYTTSFVFSGQALAVVGRFSLAGGSLKVPDTARNPRGMALELRGADGGFDDACRCAEEIGCIRDYPVGVAAVAGRRAALGKLVGDSLHLQHSVCRADGVDAEGLEVCRRV